MITNIFVVAGLGVLAVVVMLTYNRMQEKAVKFELNEQAGKFGKPGKVTKSDDYKETIKKEGKEDEEKVKERLRSLGYLDD